MAIDIGKLEDFLGRFTADLGATVAAGNVVIGHRLGLYRALAAGPADAGELAARTGTSPRYIAEWLCGQAAGGYVQYDPSAGLFSMTEEQAFAPPTPTAASTCQARSCLPWARSRPSSGSPRRSAPAPGWAGMNTTKT